MAMELFIKHCIHVHTRSSIRSRHMLAQVMVCMGVIRDTNLHLNTNMDDIKGTGIKRESSWKPKADLNIKGVTNMDVISR